MKRMKSRQVLLLCALMAFLVLPLSSCSNDDSSDPVIENNDPDPDPQPDPDPDPDPDPEVSSTSVLRINSGGPEISYGDVIFGADAFFSEAQSEVFTNPEVTSIEGTDQDEIYLTERISVDFRGSFSYDIPITNGDYRVILHFAEIFWGQPGEGSDGGVNSRIFDVEIEGSVLLDNYDILSKVAGATATTETFIVTVADEELNILLKGIEDKPKLSAIEIEGDGSLLN